MSGGSGRKGGRWPWFGAAAVLCVLVIVTASLLQQRSIVSARQVQAAKVGSFVEQSVTPALDGLPLKEPIGHRDAQPLDARLEPLVTGSGPVVRVRVFSTSGRLLYSTDDGDRVGTEQVGDVDALRAAAGGVSTDLLLDDRVAVGAGDPQSFRLLQLYAPLQRNDHTAGVVSVDEKYRGIEAAAKQPWGTVQLGAAIAAVLCLVLALFGLARAIASKQLAARSGFVGAKAGRPAKRQKGSGKEARALQQLEQQVSTLRAEVQKRDEDSAQASREFAAQLQVVTRRAEEAESRVLAGTDDHPDDERVIAAEQRALQAQQEIESFRQQIVEAQRAVDEASRRAEEAERRAEEAAELALTGGSAVDVAAYEQRAEASASKIAELEARLAEALRAAAAQPENAGARADVEGLAELQETRTALEEAGRRIAELEAASERAGDPDVTQRRVAELEAERDELEANVAQLASRTGDLDHRAKELDERLREAVQFAKDADAARRQAEAAGDAARADVATLTADRDRAVAERDDALERLTAAGSSVAELEGTREELEGIRKELEIVSAALAERDTSLQSLGEALAEQATEVGDLRSELDGERERARTAEDRATATEQRANGAEQLATELEQRVASLASALEHEAELREDVDRTATESDARLREATERAQALEERLVELERELLEAREQAAVSQADATEAGTTIASFRERAELAEQALAEREREAMAVSDSATEAQARLASLEARATDAESHLVEVQRRAEDAEARAADLERRATAAEEALAIRPEEPAEPSPVDTGDDRLESLERLVAELGEELQQTQLRLRRAYADAEDARAQLEFVQGGGTIGPGATDEEARRLRAELSHAMERAAAAESRASQLRADLLEARPNAGVLGPFADDRISNGSELELQPASEPEPGSASDVGSELEPGSESGSERSLRFRLAKTAARKRGPIGGNGSMWS